MGSRAASVCQGSQTREGDDRERAAVNKEALGFLKGVRSRREKEMGETDRIRV